MTWSAQSRPDADVQLNGHIPVAAAGDSYYFEYGVDSSQLLLQTDERIVADDATHLSVSELLPAGLDDTTYYYRLVFHTAEDVFEGKKRQVDVLYEKPVDVETGVASFPGAIDTYRKPAMILNGSVNANNALTDYYFEYGPTAAYGSVTPVASVGPALTSHFTETWDNLDTTRWFNWSSTASPHPKHEAGSGFIRTELSDLALDYNHIGQGGVGFLMLPLYFFLEKSGMGAGSPDFRDARIDLTVRGTNFNANGVRFNFWAQSQKDITVPFPWIRANWDLISYPMEGSLTQGDWVTNNLKLWNDASKWRYSGNNIWDQGPMRYQYISLNETLRNLNIDFLLPFVHVDNTNVPTGTIDFDELQIHYRNYSLLHDLNGGHLISWPTGASDPFTIADGRTNGQQYSWLSEPDPIEPEFTFSFDNPVTVSKIQVHQHTEHPAKKIVLLGSQDGNVFTDLGTLELPLPVSASDNYSFATLDFPGAPQINFLKIQVPGGYDDHQWGLAEIALFGTGGELLPGAEVAGVNFDVGDLQLDKTYHYRLVASNKFGTVYGDDKTFVIENNPIILDAIDTIYYSSLNFQWDLNVSWTTFDAASEGIKFETLSKKPDWIKLDMNTGVISVNTDSPFLTDTVLTVRAFDTKGRYAIKTFTLLEKQIKFDPAPPAALIVSGNAFSYQFIARLEPEGGSDDEIRYRLLAGPQWITVDESTGVISIDEEFYDVTKPDSVVILEAFVPMGKSVQVSVKLDQETNFEIHFVDPPESLTITGPQFQYEVLAAWNNENLSNYEINYRLREGPQWLLIDATSGKMSIDLDLYLQGPSEGEIVVEAYSIMNASKTLRVPLVIIPEEIVQLHPNPGSGVFEVRASDPGGIRSISILTPIGTVIEERLFDDERIFVNAPFDLSTRSNGVYICVVRTSSGIRSARFIIAR